MPRGKKLEKLAALIGISPAELQYGKVERSRVPGVNSLPAIDLTPDEQVLLAAYRQLPEYGKEALRVHATRLLEEFAPRSAVNPFGKAGTQ